MRRADCHHTRTSHDVIFYVEGNKEFSIERKSVLSLEYRPYCIGLYPCKAIISLGKALVQNQRIRIFEVLDSYHSLNLAYCLNKLLCNFYPFSVTDTVLLLYLLIWNHRPLTFIIYLCN